MFPSFPVSSESPPSAPCPGAYMNQERRLSAEKCYRSPINPSIEETHATYNYCVQKCLENIGRCPSAAPSPGCVCWSSAPCRVPASACVWLRPRPHSFPSQLSVSWGGGVGGGRSWSTPGADQP